MQGDFKDGGVFPSESELTKRFQVTRTTVRHDLDLLVNEGLLLKSQGRRNRVRIRKITKTTWNFASFSEGMRSSHEIPVSKVCKAEIVTTDEGMFFNLVRLRGIDRSAKVQFMIFIKKDQRLKPRPLGRRSSRGETQCLIRCFLLLNILSDNRYRSTCAG